MQATVIPIRELSKSLKQSWLDIQASNPNLAGPCFHPELFITVGNFDPNIHAVILREGKDILGFLPFFKDQKQLLASSIEFCYYQAIIGPPKQCWDIEEIFKKSGIRIWQFKALVDFEYIRSKRGKFEKISTARVDLTSGFEKYQDTMKYKKISYGNLRRKQQLLKRNVGPIRFVPFCNDAGVLHQILDWKISQFNRDLTWAKSVREVSEKLFYLKNDSFSGIVSALYAGDELLAGIFNLRYQGIMQAFIISHNQIFSKYSPGLILSYYLINELHTFQCKILDWGEGKQNYKWDFANSSLPIIQGNFKMDSLKEQIKSVNWLYKGLRPFVQIERKIKTKMKQLYENPIRLAN